MSDPAQGATPTIYFIDDSATMREVIKIAFRRENINVVACNDAASALAMIEQERPAVVITDVIMPDKDGYEVCQYIKQHPVLGKTPVILMSGVVNRAVAEKAFAVKADELIRKPFQPGDLIGRVKHLLTKSGQPPAQVPAVPVSQPVPQPQPVPVPPQMQMPVAPQNPAATLSNIFNAPPRANGNGNGNGQRFGTPAAPVAVAAPVSAPVSVAHTPSRIATSGVDVAKLRIEILRLEHL